MENYGSWQKGVSVNALYWNRKLRWDTEAAFLKKITNNL